jgi:ATP phosphoribosyltransferase regulatory subunit
LVPPPAAAPPAAPALPEGVTDLVGAEAERTRAVEQALRTLFRARGYDEVIAPTFEFLESFATGLGEDARSRLYQLFDETRVPLALRPDVTTSVARLAASRLRAAPRPLRLFYAQPVFRRERMYEGRPREFRQVGIELIGAAGEAADLEALRLAHEALAALGVAHAQLNVGHIGFARGCLRAAGVAPAEAPALLELVDRKDEGALAERLRALRVPAAARRPLLALPGLHGRGDALARARRLAPDAEAGRAVARLEALLQGARRSGFGEDLIVDLSEVRGMDYYTGIRFEAFAPGLGAALLSGGRYDRLVARFGGDDPAVGWALVVERVLRLERGKAAP